MVPSSKYLEIIGDKCNYIKYFKNYISPTKCVVNINRDLLKNKQYFIKPAISAFSKNVYHIKNDNQVPNTGGRKMMIQEYRKFATHSNPEYRCYYVYDKFSYCVATKGKGDLVRYISNRPIGLKRLCSKVSKKMIRLEKNIVLYRIDCYKWKNRWYVNEIEGLPGIIEEDLSNVDFNLDIMIGQRLMSLHF